jgi:formylglycine-generating enzyme required for sulfatase activity
VTIVLPLFHQLASTVLAGMVAIPAGTYRPLHPAPGQATVRVAAFRLDRDAVTRGEFAAFVARNAEWRRGGIEAARADSSYLASWSSDVIPGSVGRADEPVTEVSWFAADAYCRAQGKRLPTTAEWEYVAAASETKRDATSDPAFIRRLVALYSTQGTNTPFRNAFGVSGMHGVIWEWTDDDGHRAHMAGHSPESDPTCAGAALGASDATNYPAFLREAVRASLTPRSSARHLGFRCAAG